MASDQIEHLRKLATAFHDTIVRTDFDEIGLNLKRFPYECCHHACKLLGSFIYENGFTGVTMISGRRPDEAEGSHLWLEADGIIIDVTAYQFDGVTEKVIVNHSSDWHSALNGHPLVLGLKGGSAESYFGRIRKFYNENHAGLYDRIVEEATSGLQ